MNNLDEHDITKKMLNRIREGAVQQNFQEITGPELTEEEDKFRSIVASDATFNPFKVFPDEQNAIFSGKLKDGLEFQMSLEKDDSIFISVDNLQLTDAVVKKINAIRGFYKNWYDDWNTKMAKEYSTTNK
jgi:hypothetical protein